ncbi:hypothetical protein HNP86_001856 [Methanococcus maripaludis]|uniref:Uncharacterized protein n=1 Tax=Methanococcus maripaludis TaxID=39152 RepID=A0A7J9NWJ9_METMI|nr:hypothetical protein [Methanococcus maripaludis]MBA2851697.1 hypothetical protein [Methanococcus maripaludis]
MSVKLYETFNCLSFGYIDDRIRFNKLPAFSVYDVEFDGFHMYLSIMPSVGQAGQRLQEDPLAFIQTIQTPKIVLNNRPLSSYMIKWGLHTNTPIMNNTPYIHVENTKSTFTPCKMSVGSNILVTTKDGRVFYYYDGEITEVTPVGVSFDDDIINNRKTQTMTTPIYYNKRYDNYVNQYGRVDYIFDNGEVLLNVSKNGVVFSGGTSFTFDDYILNNEGLYKINDELQITRATSSDMLEFKDKILKTDDLKSLP